MKNFIKGLGLKVWGLFKKSFKYLFVIGLIVWGVYSFKQQFNIVHQDGVFGIVTETKWHQIENDKVEAQLWRATPSVYDYSSME
ncbi:MAG TPA: hypothetical protein VIU13_14315 [Chryseolinea sp.]